MTTKTFNIDGRDYEIYYLSNRQILDLIKSDKTGEEDKKFLMERVLKLFEYDLCPDDGETEDEVFSRFFGKFVNGKMCSREKVAEALSREHRYLQNEIFKVCMAYITKLADNCENGIYDGRNEYACNTSKIIIDHLKEIDYLY